MSPRIYIKTISEPTYEYFQICPDLANLAFSHSFSNVKTWEDILCIQGPRHGRGREGGTGADCLLPEGAGGEGGTDQADD